MSDRLSIPTLSGDSCATRPARRASQAIERGARHGCTGTPVTYKIAPAYTVGGLGYLRGFRLETRA